MASRFSTSVETYTTFSPSSNVMVLVTASCARGKRAVNFSVSAPCAADSGMVANCCLLASP